MTPQAVHTWYVWMMEAASEYEQQALPGMLQRVGPGDPSGAETYGTYEYQVKYAVWLWIQTLHPKGPDRILLEYVEDIIMVYPDRVRFCQVKTRKPTRSAWSFSTITKDGGGLDSLCRAFTNTRHMPGSYELFLEGRCSASPPTKDFFADPTCASAKCRQELVQGVGFKSKDLDEFLARLRINAYQFTQTEIDDKILISLMRIIQSITYLTANEIYRNLLDAARAAQQSLPFTDSAKLAEIIDSAGPYEAHSLTQAKLLGLLPSQPYPAAEWEHLIRSPGISHLERKMRLADVSQHTLAEAKRLRAIADVRLRTALAGSTAEAEYATAVAENVLRTAKTLAAAHRNSTNTADHVMVEFMRSYDALKSHDHLGIFASPHELVGLVCQKSDECLFPWRVS